MTATKLAAFARNAAPTPHAAIASPPSAGPMRRPPLNSAELSATAVDMSSVPPTISTTNAWRAGTSNAFTTPNTTAIAATCQYRTTPRTHRMPRHRARTRNIACVHTSRRRFDTRSTSAPAGSDRTRTGDHCSELTTPSRKAECVSSRTSHA